MQPNEKKYLVIVENQKKLMLYRDLLAPVSNVTCDSTYGYIVRIADNAKSVLG